MSELDSYGSAIYGGLGLTEEERERIRKQQLMAMGAAMLAGRGNFANNLGQGMLTAINQGESATTQLRRDKLAEMEMQYRQGQIAAQRQAAQAALVKEQAAIENAKKAAALRGEIGTVLNTDRPQNIMGSLAPTPRNAQTLETLAADPEAFRRAQYERAIQMATLGGDKDVAKQLDDLFAKVNPTYGTSPMEVRDPVSQQPALIVSGNFGQQKRLPYDPKANIGAVNPANFQPQALANFARTGDYNALTGAYIDTTPRSNTTIKLPPGQTKWEEKIGGDMAEEYTAIQKASRNATNRLVNLETINKLLEGVTTGGMTPAMTKFQNMAASVGMKIGPDLDVKQAAAMLSNEAALQARNPASGGGITGNMSNFDLQFLIDMTPGLIQSSEGRAVFLETQRLLTKRTKDIARMATKYRMSPADFETKFQDEVDEYDRNMDFSGLAARARAIVGGGGKKQNFRN